MFSGEDPVGQNSFISSKFLGIHVHLKRYFTKAVKFSGVSAFYVARNQQLLNETIDHILLF